ncbi:hypothetical protein ZHAS_00008868 [Anopheles sinensis]|uniref:Uncharacterized protein n=1 Tax=Anopheles sinensis TaxID=74873 RepID=A0A084VTI2_ANOSI|nr:hypothetical protein ZHAS_00008868 [Anopheles sinensis]
MRQCTINLHQIKTNPLPSVSHENSGQIPGVAESHQPSSNRPPSTGSRSLFPEKPPAQRCPSVVALGEQTLLTAFEPSARASGVMVMLTAPKKTPCWGSRDAGGGGRNAQRNGQDNLLGRRCCQCHRRRRSSVETNFV